jgi:demethylmenaquinone methyltransferase/2-methoxy-6-polyprenyl-1,4-benzoquinol methylase
MLRRAGRRRVAGGAGSVAYYHGDARSLPLADASVDAATIAFGLRNVADHRRAIDEMLRVTRPGGRVVVLEIATPTGRVGRLVTATWFERLVPLLGRLLGRGAAYRYLPDSVRGYPPPAAIAALMAEAGLTDVRWRPLTLGMVTLHVGRRPGGV